MSLATANSFDLAYPERFYAAASYAGFGGSAANSSSQTPIFEFPDEVTWVLYALYQQATVGPCNVARARSWSPVEQNKWNSWKRLGNMASTEAMHLFVRILEEEDPAWYSRVPEFVIEPVVDVEMNEEERTEKLLKLISADLVKTRLEYERSQKERELTRESRVRSLYEKMKEQKEKRARNLQ